MATAKNNPDIYMDNIDLASIVGIHENLKKAMMEFGYLADEPFPVNSQITRDAVIALLDLIPIHVTHHSTHHYWLCGGFRMYALVRHLIGENTEVPMLVHEKRIDQQRMNRQLATEYALLPLLLNPLEPKEVLHRLDKVKEHLPNSLDLGTREERAQLLGVSMRTFAALNETPKIQS